MQQITITKTQLYEDYVINEFSVYDCAKKYGCNPSTIRNKLIKYDIPKRLKNQYTQKRLKKLKNNKNLGSKTKEYYKKIKETGIIPENELRRRAKIGNWSKNFERTDAHKENIGRALLGNKNCLGREVSKKTKIKISESLKELYKDKTKHPLYGKHHSQTTRDKISNSHLKENLSDDALKNMREGTIKRIERQRLDGMPLSPSIGFHEKEILDKYEKIIGSPIIRQYRIAGFFVDGYCKEKNIVFEVDEEHHKRHKGQDLCREIIIKKALNCDIIRIKVGEINE